jgi:hypothetical protein
MNDSERMLPSDLTNATNFLVDDLAQIKRVKPMELVFESLFDGYRHTARLQDSMIRSLGDIVHFDNLSADAAFSKKFYRGEKEVVEEPPLRGVESIEEVDKLRFVEALIAEPLTDMGPVFLLDVSVIILVVGARAGELDRVFAVVEVTQEVPVEEFGAVVAVKTSKGEREGCFDGLDLG